MLKTGGFVNTNDIVLAIDSEIAQLQKVKALLTDIDVTTKRRPGRPARVRTGNDAVHLNPETSARKPKRRTMSTEGRAKIAEAQKLRWEESKKAAKKAAREPASSPVKT